MTEIQLHQPGAAPALATVTGGSMPGLQILGDWLQAASHASQLVAPLVDSFFVPDAYKVRVSPNASDDERANARGVVIANATSAVLLGMSLGLDPLTSLQQIYVVHGRPGMYAKIKVALAQTRGHRVWDEEYGAERVTVAGQRAGTDDVVRITITIEDAKRAGWTSNAAYSKTPADMLWARAASRVVDRIAADVLHGIASVEDIDPDDRPAAVAADIPAPARTSAAAILARAEQVPAPAATPTDRIADEAARAMAEAVREVAAVLDRPAEPEIQRYVMPISKHQGELIKAAFEKHGLGGQTKAAKADRLRVTCELIGHEIADAKELTGNEARLILDHIAGDAGLSVIQQILGTTPAPVTEEPVDQGEAYDPTTEADWARDEAAGA